ncbi:hypothetical protein chiPu_0031182, partial [Chiloscyllium punctatum]|nr:hypothetical protein [Chiloscyllium punctatum]
MGTVRRGHQRRRRRLRTFPHREKSAPCDPIAGVRQSQQEAERLPPGAQEQEIRKLSTPVLHRAATAVFGLALLATSGSAALAQKKYDTGASDTEIKIGNIVPYSGPASAYGVVGKAMTAVFKKVNDDGGINGRKINFISYDDAYSPPKAVEQ